MIWGPFCVFFGSRSWYFAFWGPVFHGEGVVFLWYIGPRGVVSAMMENVKHIFRVSNWSISGEIGGHPSPLVAASTSPLQVNKQTKRFQRPSLLKLKRTIMKRQSAQLVLTADVLVLGWCGPARGSFRGRIACACGSRICCGGHPELDYFLSPKFLIERKFTTGNYNCL